MLSAVAFEVPASAVGCFDCSAVGAVCSAVPAVVPAKLSEAVSAVEAVSVGAVVAGAEDDVSLSASAVLTLNVSMVTEEMMIS